MKSTYQTKNKLNIIGNSKLTRELNILNKEKRASLRMQDNVERQFHSKYINFDQCPTSSRLSESAGVLYETHTPGFCYRRNGEYKTPHHNLQENEKSDSDIGSLVQDVLFTGDEIDIEKVICLHLLATHNCTEDDSKRIMEQKSKKGKLSFLDEGNRRPYEKMLKESYKKSTNCSGKFVDSETSLVKHLLPIYILGINEHVVKNTSRENINDFIFKDQLSLNLNEKTEKNSRKGSVVVNDKIIQLVDSVLHGLRKANPKKMKRLLDMAQDPAALRRIIHKPSVKAFLSSVSAQSILSGANSFHIENPSKNLINNLDIITPSSSLEQLVFDIRNGIIQHSEADSNWGSGFLSKESSMRDSRNTTPVSQTISGSELASLNESKYSRNKLGRMDIASIASFLNSTFKETCNRELKYAKPVKKTSESTVPKNESEIESVETKDVGKPFTLRQTTCAACLERWRKPHPTPKLPSIRKRNNKLVEVNAPINSKAKRVNKSFSDSPQQSRRVSSNSTDDQKNPASNLAKNNQSSFLEYNENITLNKLDLERITQQIAKKETQKRLEKFLEE